VKRATRRYTDYFHVEEEKQGRFSFRQDNHKIDEKLNRAGFFVLLTNDPELSSEDVLSIYRGRDAIEKAFDQFKNGLDFRRLRIHTGKTMDGKVFVGFMALVMRSYMLKKAKESQVTKHLTLEKILLELRKIKTVTYDGDTSGTIMPLTKMQRDILETFGSSAHELITSLLP